MSDTCYSTFTVLSFFKVIPVKFQAVQHHHVEQCTSEGNNTVSL